MERARGLLALKPEGLARVVRGAKAALRRTSLRAQPLAAPGVTGGSFTTAAAGRRRRRTGCGGVKLVVRAGASASPGDGGSRRPPSSSKRAIALRRYLYSPALVAFSCCVLKAVSFGFKPLGVLMTCSMLGFTVPFGPQTLWDTVPCCALVGALLYFTSRMELDWVARMGILLGGLGAVYLSWRVQGPVPSLPRRVPQYIQARLERQYEREAFLEKTARWRDGGGRAEVASTGRPKG